MVYGRIIAGFALALGILAATERSQAAELAASHFEHGPEGWRNGEFTVGNDTRDVTWDPAGFISVGDNYPHNALLAPDAFLGDQTAAIGGTLSLDLGSDFSDDAPDAPLVTLVGGDVLLYGGVIATPPASGGGFTHYVVALTAANFLRGAPDVMNGVAVSDAEFAQVIAHLRQLSINADFHDGDDHVRLDNVVLSSPSASATPEPASWALLVGGFGLAGASIRGRMRPA